MGASAPTAAGSANSGSAGTSLTINVSGNPPIGCLLRVTVRFGSTGQTPASCSVSDSAGNTWTIRNTTGTPSEILADCIVASSLSGGTVTVTGSNSASARIGFLYYVTQVNQGSSRLTAIAPNVPVFQGTARNIGGSTVTPTAVGDYVEGVWSLDATETSLTAASGYTVGPTFTGNGYFTSNTLSLETVYQIVSAVNAKEPKATGGASPIAYGAYALAYKHLQPVPDPEIGRAHV